MDGGGSDRGSCSYAVRARIWDLISLIVAELWRNHLEIRVAGRSAPLSPRHNLQGFDFHFDLTDLTSLHPASLCQNNLSLALQLQLIPYRSASRYGAHATMQLIEVPPRAQWPCGCYDLQVSNTSFLKFGSGLTPIAMYSVSIARVVANFLDLEKAIVPSVLPAICTSPTLTTLSSRT